MVQHGKAHEDRLSQHVFMIAISCVASQQLTGQIISLSFSSHLCLALSLRCYCLSHYSCLCHIPAMQTQWNIPINFFHPYPHRHTHMKNKLAAQAQAGGQFHCTTLWSEGVDSSALAHWPRHQQSALLWHPSASIRAPDKGGRSVFAGQQVECCALSRQMEGARTPLCCDLVRSDVWMSEICPLLQVWSWKIWHLVHPSAFTWRVVKFPSGTWMRH